MIVSWTLNEISSGMGISVPEAGQLITAFAVSCCLGAPLFASLASRVERRLLLTVALGIFALGHAASALADSLGLLLGMRFLSAFGSAIFTPQAAATVSLLVPQAERGKAVGTIFLGWSIDSVLGLPLGHAIGAAWGWRAAMWVAMSVLQSSGMFVLFAYMAPYFKSVMGASDAMIGVTFACFGVAGVLGNMLAGPLGVAFGLSALTGLVFCWGLGGGVHGGRHFIYMSLSAERMAAKAA